MVILIDELHELLSCSLEIELIVDEYLLKLSFLLWCPLELKLLAVALDLLLEFLFGFLLLFVRVKIDHMFIIGILGQSLISLLDHLLLEYLLLLLVSLLVL